MDSNKLKDLADAQFAKSAFLTSLKETYDAKLSITHRGGTFIAKPELISFLNSWHDPEVIVEDAYNTPILVDRMLLLDDVKKAYRLASAYWAQEMQKANPIVRATDV
jgi:hypothetical protein